MGLSDYRFALEFRAELQRLVKEEVERQRPRYQMATVVSFDRALRKCTVQFPSDTTTATVSMGSIQPSAVGQVVRVEGLAGDRYIADVMGAPYEALETRVADIEAAPGETVNFILNSGFELGMDNWTTFWSNGTVNSIQYNSANAQTGANCHGSAFDNVADYQVLESAVYPVEPGQVIALSYAVKKVGTATLQSNLEVLTAPTSAGADYYGTGVTGATPLPYTDITTSYVTRRALYTIPAGHYYMRVVSRAYCTVYTSASTVYTDNITARRVLVQPPGTDPITFGGLATFNDGLSVPNNFDTDGFTGDGWDGFRLTLRGQHMLTGGGTRIVTSSTVSWDYRFIMISAGNDSGVAASGYFDITMPADGTVITGLGGASNQTVTSGAITIANWVALYYIPPLGSSATSVAANFRLVYYNSAFTVPNTWILIVQKNGDTGTYKWGDGRVQDYWRGVTYANSWVSYGGVFVGAQYKRENGFVHIRGLVTDGTISATSTGTIFTLPAGFRPGYQVIAPSVSNNALGRVDVLTDGSVRAVVGSAGSWINLYGIVFQAEQ